MLKKQEMLFVLCHKLMASVLISYATAQPVPPTATAQNSTKKDTNSFFIVFVEKKKREIAENKT